MRGRDRPTETDADQERDRRENGYRNGARRGAWNGALSVSADATHFAAAVRGQYVEAVVRFARALRSFRKLGDRLATCRTFHELGLLHTAQGHSGNALRCHNESLTLAREMGAAEMVTRALVGRARAYIASGNAHAAATSCAAARVQMSRMGDRSRPLRVFRA